MLLLPLDWINMDIHKLQIIMLGFLLITCNKNEKNYSDMERIKKEVNYMLYHAICSNSVTLAKEAFELGASPKYCKGDIGWHDSDPLDVLTENIMDSYYPTSELSLYDHRNLEISNLGVLDLLLASGADINKRPYIWHIAVLWGNNRIADIEKTGDIYGHQRTEEEIQKHITIYISDTNRLMEGYLKNGANPDKLGHRYPYSLDASRQKITDEQANEYFAQGTRAINEAIKKGILWESQVDLLLQYTKLDEDSLIAAEESGDPLMAEKINKLWDEQQAAMK